MPKSFGTLEEGFVNFVGGTYADVFLNVETYGRGRIQCAIVEPSYFTSRGNPGPQPPGTTYLSGSEWTFSQVNNTATTDPCGQFVSFSTTPANLTYPTDLPYPHATHTPDTVTKGAILLAKNSAGAAPVYLASSETNLFDPGTYLVTFGLCRGQALSGISATWPDSDTTNFFVIEYRRKIGGFGSDTDWTVDLDTDTDDDGWLSLRSVNQTWNDFQKEYRKSTTGIGGLYVGGGNSHQGVKGGAKLEDDTVHHFKRGFQVAPGEYWQIRFRFDATGNFQSGGYAVGLCETIIEEINKDYGDNYGYIGISAQFITDNHFRIYSSAPFWGQVAYSVSS